MSAQNRRIVADYPLIAIALLLSLYGIAMVYSAGETDVRSVAAGVWKSQIVWLALAMSVALIVSRSSVRLIEWLTWPAYAGSIALLLITLFFGSGAGTAARARVFPNCQCHAE